LSDFDEIRQIVMEDSALMIALTSVATEAALFARVIELAKERGIELTNAELAGTVRANRRAWLERWLP
jgi:hypothetical protein